MQNKTILRGAWTTAVVATAAGAAGLAHAQAARPDAGSLMQQIEQGQELQLPKVRRPAVVPEPEMKPADGMQITVTRFRFAGNTRLDERALQAAVAPWLGRPLGFGELQKAAAAAAAVYRDAGWIVRAYLPRQEIENGVVTIQIVEAVFGKAQIEAADSIRVGTGTVRRMVLAAQAPGEALNADAIDRALLIVDDLPGVAAQGLLKEGEQNGETDLVLKLEPEPLVMGNVAYDNTGARSTGAQRLSGVLFGNSPLKLGDQASAQAIHTEGSDYLRAAWSVPVGPSGLRLGLNHSMLEYRVVTPDFASLNLKGHSSSTGIEALYPLIRSRAKNLYANVNYDRKRYYNESNGIAISDYSLAEATLGLSGNLFDEIGGGGSSSGSLSFVSGRVDLERSPNRQADANGTRTAGKFQLLRYSLRRQQVLTPQASLVAAWSGQFASRNLDSSEKMYLGGVNGVRAYPASEAGGSEGNLINLEARYALPANLTASAFYDYGRIRVNRDNSVPGAVVRNNQTLQGAGLGLGWAASSGANVRVIWAHRIGSNPNPNPTTGNDQDGTRTLNRFWLQAGLPF